MVNEALAQYQCSSDVVENRQATALDDVLVHVRYHPNGEIFSIGERPARLSAREWLTYLLDAASPHYQLFAGGRGFFRIPRPKFETMLEGLST